MRPGALACWGWPTASPRCAAASGSRPHPEEEPASSPRYPAMPEPPPAIRVVLADDSVLFREGLARVLADNGFAVVGQAADADALHEVVGQAEPDVVVT